MSGSYFDGALNGSASTLVFDGTHAAHGLLSLKFSPTTATQTGVGWSSELGGALTDHYARLYVYLPADPPTTVTILRGYSAGSGVWKVMLNPNRTLQLANGSGAVFPSAAGSAVSTTPCPLNAWCRLELHAVQSTTTGQLTLRIYASSPDGTTPDETVATTNAINDGASVDEIRFTEQ